jgi:CxxC-x17-CxxC domain-containing protein
MGDFNRSNGGGNRRGGFGGGGFGGGGRSSGRPSFGRSGFGGRDRGDDRQQMHKAVCSDCGDQCEVPFRPSGDKPVFCNDCFKNGGDRDNRGSSRNNDFGRDRFNKNDSYQDKGRDSYKDSFKEKEPARDLNKETREQLDILNAKLDRIISLIAPVIKVSKDDITVSSEEPAAKIEAKTEKDEKAVKAPKKAKKAKTV